MEFKFEVKLTAKQLFEFLIYHTYSSFSGYIGVVVSLCALMAGFYTFGSLSLSYSIMLILSGLLFTVINPVLLYRRAGNQVNQSNMPIFLYLLNGTGMHVTVDGNQNDYPWSDITKVTSTKSDIVIYVEKNKAYILPKEAIGDQLEQAKSLIRNNVTCNSVKLR